MVGGMGGYMGRKKDPSTGLECRWRGFETLRCYVETTRALMEIRSAMLPIRSNISLGKTRNCRACLPQSLLRISCILCGRPHKMQETHTSASIGGEKSAVIGSDSGPGLRSDTSNLRIDGSRKSSTKLRPERWLQEG